MKRTLSLILVLLICASLSACDESSPSNVADAIGDGSESATEAVQAETVHNEPICFDEYDALPTPENCADVYRTSKRTSSVNGVTKEIYYAYVENGEQKLGGALVQTYQDCLKEAGFAINVISNNEFEILDDSVMIATVSYNVDSKTLAVNIIPEQDRMVVKGAKELKIGDVIELDFVKMTIESISLEDEIYPADTSGAYLYISDVDGSQYICLRGQITNRSSSNLDGRYLAGKVTINGEYSYDTEFSIGANPAATTDYALEPLGTAHYYLYANIPDAAIDLLKTGTITIAFNDDFARSNGRYAHTYMIDFTK